MVGLQVADSGKIYYSGVSGKKYDSNKYRAKVGYVTQDIHLFSGTFRANLISDQVISDVKIWEVLEQVGAKSFVQHAGGLNGVILESGKSLSGGQRRRLGIARALLRGADILIFDEIVSGLDLLNKNSIHELIEKLSSEHVIVWISHDSWKPKKSIIYTIR